MQFLKKIFSSFQKNKEAMELPAEIELIPNELWAKVAVHSIPVIENNGNPSGLSFLTRGMVEKGQQELFLVLKTNKIGIDDVPQEPLFFFQQVYKLASQGLFAKEGSITQFGEKDLWGWKGVLYAKAPQHLHKVLPKNCLSMVLLNLEELQAVQEYGFTRILSMMGKQTRYFFFPYWVDDYRANLPIRDVKEKTLVGRTARLVLPEANLTLLQRKHLYLKIEKNAGKKLQEIIIPNDRTLTILPSLAEEADACLTWALDETRPMEAITLPNSTGQVMGGCVLIMIPNQSANACRILEDGFAIAFDQKTWDDFWQAFKSQKVFEMKTNAEGIDFSLVFS